MMPQQQQPQSPSTRAPGEFMKQGGSRVDRHQKLKEQQQQRQFMGTSPMPYAPSGMGMTNSLSMGNTPSMSMMMPSPMMPGMMNPMMGQPNMPMPQRAPPPPPGMGGPPNINPRDF